MTSPFLDLPVGKLESLVDISLNPHFYEEKTAQSLGFFPLRLPMLKRNDGRLLDFCKGLIFNNFDVNTKEKMICEKYSSLDCSCSMNVENADQLLKFAHFAYQVSYANYVVMIREHPSFPYNVCGRASENVSLALQLHGFPNATWMYDNPNDHAYVGLPFVMQHTSEQGFILVDPTSDQLWNVKKPRNMVRIVSGTRWEYVTEYAQGNDLYPTKVQHIGSMKQRRKERGLVIESMDDFLNHVFTTQVSVDIYNSYKHIL